MPRGEHCDRCVGQAELEVCVPVDEFHSGDDVVRAEFGQFVRSIRHVLQQLPLHSLTETV
jgi:hypothetical protein